MKVRQTLLLISFFLIATLATSAQSQKIDTSRLWATWALEKQVFLEPKKDSANIRKSNEGYVVTFGKANVFRTRQMKDSTVNEVGMGTYEIDPHGKHIIQNGVSFEIIQLTEQRLVLKNDELKVEMHFRKIVLKD